MYNSKSVRILLICGLLVVAGSQILSRYLALPDFIFGCLIGMGIGIELGAFVLLKRLKTVKR
jgi:hypothetical protein